MGSKKSLLISSGIFDLFDGVRCFLFPTCRIPNYFQLSVLKLLYDSQNSHHTFFFGSNVSICGDNSLN